jgi:hypothetical protein
LPHAAKASTYSYVSPLKFQTAAKLLRFEILCWLQKLQKTEVIITEERRQSKACFDLPSTGGYTADIRETERFYNLVSQGF